ncbi:MAG TPA: hypothetical protein VFV24_07915 [Candidatus Eisenbacteria bacterium]|nr:hypothetical protein [Candidatus Eisenbacteria bacterium]
MIIYGVLAGLVAGIVQGSFFEWAFHRFWLHRPWLPKDCFTTHTLIHHQLCKFEDTFHVTHEEQHEALHFAWWGGPTLIAIGLAPWVLLSWGLHASGVTLPYVAYLVAFSVASVLYYIGYEGFHYLMHKPMLPFIERSRVFQFLKRHHRIHHVHMNRNLNVLVPLADLVLGTLVTEVPVARATPPSAIAIARKHSKRPRS